MVKCQTWTLCSCYNLSRLKGAVCQRSAVLLWLQLWGQTPLISENWIWVTTTAGLRSEGAVWFSTESNLSTGDSEVRHHVLLLKVQCVEFSDICWWSVILQLNTTPPPPPPPFQTWKRTCGSFSCHRNSKGLVCPVCHAENRKQAFYNLDETVKTSWLFYIQFLTIDPFTWILHTGVELGDMQKNLMM